MTGREPPDRAEDEEFLSAHDSVRRRMLHAGKPDTQKDRTFEELQAIGLEIHNLNDLILLDAQSGPMALSTLPKYLPRLEEPSSRDAVVRAMTDDWARPDAARPLVEEFMSERNAGTMVRWR